MGPAEAAVTLANGGTALFGKDGMCDRDISVGRLKSDLCLFLRAATYWLVIIGCRRPCRRGSSRTGSPSGADCSVEASPPGRADAGRKRRGGFISFS